ncbi:vigilin [Spathaspora passalidarum NRRL Y-27907]|uniref:Vigilin n=1 Tax=Spathaspora passalidarum (strain NRRL Y-27907 / 11-Y1) TaxID=619300 RepID=G3AN09_SPAPN|nr:vigilin [Spathaspora passalidarum NRRL Y-27907]EGW32423.1 vigilin [Spathaspora passalidarum NRRL Y-27907]
MPTPAEIIAARLNNENLYDDAVAETLEVPANNEEASAKRSISDEVAFPTLGGKQSSSPSPVPQSIPSWGPSMKTPVSVSSTPKSTRSPTPRVVGNGMKSKVSTIQEAFALNVEDQLNVARPDFIKILTFVKQETKTSIECTTSQHTKKRTFLITGRPEEVKLAKRLVIKKLTKPVQIAFTVPAKLRSRIIGQGGKNLKPIIQANEVKIEIGDEEEEEVEQELADNVAADEDHDDIFSKTVTVTIDGDIEGSKRAKNQILAIVKEETKNLSTKVPVDEIIKPFAQKALESVVTKYADLDFAIPDYKSEKNNIVIVGDRDSVIEARIEIRSILEKLADKITVEEVPIPKVKHQFLPIDQILEEVNVLIQLPKEGESNVKFIGEKSKIKLAQEQARKTTSQYKIEVLDMSKAHRGNLKHVKAVAAHLNQNGVFKEIAQTNDVKINVPEIASLSDETLSSIPIEIVSKGDDEKIKVAKKSIVNHVNRITPDQTQLIQDIDEFLLGKVDETIKDVAKSTGVNYVVLGKNITLFSEKLETEEAEDFEETNAAEDSFKKVDEALNKLRELATKLQTVVLEVDSKDQQHVSGPRGTTLRSILSSVEPNSITVKLHSNGEKQSDNEIFIRGFRESVSAVRKDIEQVISDAQEFKDGYTATIQVPANVISRIIGKSGANLISLRDEFGTKIDVADEKEDNKAKNAKVDVTITGIKRNVEETKSKLASMAKKWADETLVRLRIEHQYHRRMIGPHGIYINRLQDKYNVKIRFPSSDNVPSNFADAPKTKDEVTVKGPSKGVAKAEEELNELYQFEKENGFKQVIQIPTKAVARVIGKAGETIKDIADGSGVEYKFNRNQEEEEKSGFAEVELTGSKSALKEASKKINDIIEEIENFVSTTIKVNPIYHRDLIGQGGSVMKEIISKAGGDDIPRNKHFRLLNIPNEGSGSDEITSQGDKQVVEKIIQQIKDIVALKEASVTEEIDLPKEKHRLIIGPKGTIRHSIQDEFGVTVEIPRSNEESTIVKIVGLPEKIAAAKEKIEELTKDDWNVSIDVPSVYHALVSEHGAIFKQLKSDFNVEVTHGNLTRQASKLSSASTIPTAPEEAYPTDSANYLFTIVENDEELKDDGVVIPWRLKGEEASTAKAAKVIEDRLANAKSAKFTGWFYSAQSSAFSKIIGPQGSKVNQIRKKSNTFITIPRANDKESKFIYLVGSEDNLKIAKEEIQRLL